MRRTSLALAGLLLVLATVTPAVAGAPQGNATVYLLPLRSGPVDPAAGLAERDPDGADLVLVQWERFGDPDAVERIAATGATLVQPLAPVSYLVWADATQTELLRELDGIRFAGVLPPARRVSRNVTDDTSLLRVTLVGDVTVDEGLQANVRPRHFTEVAGTVVLVPGDREDALRIARHPRVYSVGRAPEQPQLRDEQSSQIVAQGTDDGAHAAPGYRAFLDRIGADGTGVTVSLVDSGADANHPDLEGRVRACSDHVTPDGAPSGCDAGNSDDAIGHGTHVLGIAIGTGETEHQDDDGFSYGLGVAPGAEAVVANAISLAATSPFADGYTPIYTEAVRAGATVSNNSWGPAGTPQGYDEDTREFDTIVRDADPETPGDQPITLSWSIMNGRGGTSTQGSPDEAKNLIAVGASGARQDDIAGTGPGSDDLCSCTAHGPNLDGRRLVDLVAPGENVVSLRATQSVLCGSPAAGFTPVGSPGYLPRPPSPYHGVCTGTSMASPHVTGAYAVFVEWFRRNIAGDDTATPSPALVKAAMVNTADDLSGSGGRDADGEALTSIPNDQQGWGRLNLGQLIDAWQLGTVAVDQEVALTSSGQSYSVDVQAVDPTAPLKVTLAWTDAPGHGLGGELPAWVNDLDLVVTGPDGTWLGNVFTGGWSAVGGTADRMNNLESVFLPEAGPGVYRITVDAANVIGKASPNVDDLAWQDFALVVSNATVASTTEG